MFCTKQSIFKTGGLADRDIRNCGNLPDRVAVRLFEHLTYSTAAIQ
jgi:hypothetical protein